jgi:hypothetical protein
MKASASHRLACLGWSLLLMLHHSFLVNPRFIAGFIIAAILSPIAFVEVFVQDFDQEAFADYMQEALSAFRPLSPWWLRRFLPYLPHGATLSEADLSEIIRRHHE